MTPGLPDMVAAALLGLGSECLKWQYLDEVLDDEDMFWVEVGRQKGSGQA